MRTLRALLSAGVVLLAGLAHAEEASHALRGSEALAVAVVPAGSEGDKLPLGFYAEGGAGQSPQNAKEMGGKIVLTVKPYEEAVQITNGQFYTGGRFDFLVKSAAITPGIITAVYISSGKGRRSDSSTGAQDEIDLEWKGNDPDNVQTNVFIDGQEDIQILPVGNSAAAERHYAIEWTDFAITFYIDGQPVRSKMLMRPLKPMSLKLSVWTTSGGWPGLINWAGGPPDWDHMADKSATATFQVISLPH